MKRFVRFTSGCLILGLLASGLTAPLRAQGDDPLTLLTTIEVGGSPSAIVVDCLAGRNDVIFYGNDKVRFIDGDTLTLVPEEISLLLSLDRQIQGFVGGSGDPA
ncbi:MAG: hypothetical protein ACETWR_09670 [Anaerolineae bacterium]